MGKYEEALERARQGKPIDEVFPELKESKDERIRKEILEYFNQYKEEGLRGVNITPWIAYLEKQKEQKPLPPFDEMSPEERMNHPLYLEGFNVGKSVGEALKGREKCVADGSKTSVEWSEEEKKHLYNAIEAIKYVYDTSEGTSGFKCIKFLKALHPHWKPSEEQMEALRRMKAAIAGEGEIYKPLNSLYDDLKKLM